MIKAWKYIAIAPAILSGVFTRSACEGLWDHDMDKMSNCMLGAVVFVAVAVFMASATDWGER